MWRAFLGYFSFFFTGFYAFGKCNFRLLISSVSALRPGVGAEGKFAEGEKILFWVA
jgi:hypothetical protein